MRTAVFLSLVAALCLTQTAQAGAKVVVVKPKATLWGIAKRHRVSVNALRKANGMTTDDVLRAGQRLRIPRGKRKASLAGGKKSKVDSSWVYAKPPRWTQTQKTRAERGGINPCNTPNPGWGSYTKWDRAPLLGQMVMPKNKKLLADGKFDVVFHFHGHEPIRKEWVQVMDRTVLVAVTLGVGSAPYIAAFSSPNRFEQLVRSVERRVAKHIGKKKARARRIGLSSWSAGYGALLRILDQPYGKRRVDTAVVLDGMHSSYQNGRASVSQLAPFIRFARRAKKRDKFMFISHSSIIPPGYASSTETANLLLHSVGRKTPSRKAAELGPDGPRAHLTHVEWQPPRARFRGERQDGSLRTHRTVSRRARPCTSSGAGGRVDHPSHEQNCACLGVAD